jgi:hypothetical protein
MRRIAAGKLSRSVLFVLPLLLVFISLAFADVPINIFPGSQSAAGGGQEDKIHQIVKQNFDLDDTILHKVNVKLLYDDSGNPDHLIVYLLSKHTYSYTTTRLNLNADYTVSSMVSNYEEQEEDYYQDSPGAYAECPDQSVDMVFSTCETGIPTAVAGVNKAVEIAESKGYKVEKLLGSEENTTAIKNWLACDNLVLFGRIGHGSPTGIQLKDGNLSYSYFQGLSSTALNRFCISIPARFIMIPWSPPSLMPVLKNSSEATLSWGSVLPKRFSSAGWIR